MEKNTFRRIKVVADAPQNKHSANDSGAKLKGGKGEKGGSKSKENLKDKSTRANLRRRSPPRPPLGS